MMRMILSMVCLCVLQALAQGNQTQSVTLNHDVKVTIDFQPATWKNVGYYQVKASIAHNDYGVAQHQLNIPTLNGVAQHQLNIPTVNPVESKARIFPSPYQTAIWYGQNGYLLSTRQTSKWNQGRKADDSASVPNITVELSYFYQPDRNDSPAQAFIQVALVSYNTYPCGRSGDFCQEQVLDHKMYIYQGQKPSILSEVNNSPEIKLIQLPLQNYSNVWNVPQNSRTQKAAPQQAPISAPRAVRGPRA